MSTQYWFTSDTHFNHARIIQHSNRPFANVEEMNNVLIDNINSLVKPNDILFHLGDWSMGKCKRTRDAKLYLDQIRCKNIHLILGNHDPHDGNYQVRPEFASLFKSCQQCLTLNVNIKGEPKQIFMFHYACRVWYRSHYGSYHLFGHSHGMLPKDDVRLSMDVGVDPNNYKPVSLEQVAAEMATKKFVPIIKRRDEMLSPEQYEEWRKDNEY